MTVEQILKLAEMGYTKAEIEALNAPPAEDTKPAGVETAADSPEQQPEEQPKENSVNVMAEMMKGYLETMQNTLKEIQKANIKTSVMPEQKDNIDDALAAIITPTKRNK